MPQGKLSVSGGGAFILRDPSSVLRTTLTMGVNVRSFRHLAKPGTSPLSAPELRVARDVLRTAVKIYEVDAASPAPTGTERARKLNAVKSAAKRLLAKPSSAVWAERLAGALDALAGHREGGEGDPGDEAGDQDGQARLRKAIMRNSGAEFARLESLVGELHARASLRRVRKGAAARAAEFAVIWLPTIRMLAEIEVTAMAPKGALWRDPGLAKLVLSLAPIWRRVTGRTAARVSANREGDVQACPFAEWLDDLCEKIGRPRPRMGRVVAIVRAENQKIPPRHGDGIEG